MSDPVDPGQDGGPDRRWFGLSGKNVAEQTLAGLLVVVIVGAFGWFLGDGHWLVVLGLVGAAAGVAGFMILIGLWLTRSPRPVRGRSRAPVVLRLLRFGLSAVATVWFALAAAAAVAVARTSASRLSWALIVMCVVATGLFFDFTRRSWRDLRGFRSRRSRRYR